MISNLQRSLDPGLECLTRVKYKIDHILKIKNHTKKNHEDKESDSEHSESFKLLVIISYY